MDGTLIVLGLLSALSIFVVMCRINVRRFMGYPALVDVATCIGLGWALHGSFGGMVAAITGSLFFSSFIWVFRKIWGYERFKGKRGWVRTPGVLA